MKASKIALVLCVLMVLTLVATACKTEEQLAEANQPDPTVISPEVNITQEAVKQPDVLDVAGAGEVTLTPDTATFYVEIYTEAKEAAAAQADNATRTEAVTAALIAAGVSEKNIQTQNLYLTEIYDYDKSPAVITGYRMTTTLFVTVTPIDKAGVAIGAAVAAGATGTSGLSLTVSDKSEAYQQALKAAIADAAGKAAAMAEALGVELSAVPVSVTETSQSEAIPYDNGYTRSESAGIKDEVAEMPISAGEITVTARVVVVYEMLEPGA